MPPIANWELPVAPFLFTVQAEYLAFFKVEIKAFLGSWEKAGDSKIIPVERWSFFIDLNTRSVVLNNCLQDCEP